MFSKFRLTKVVLIMILVLGMSTIVSVHTQNNYNLSYRVKAGDSQIYTLTTLNGGSPHFPRVNFFVLSNGTIFPYNLTQGMQEKVTIVSSKASQSSFGGYIVDYQYSINFPRIGLVTSQIIQANWDLFLNPSEISPAFNNESIINTYLKDQYSMIQNTSAIIFTYKVSGEYYTIYTNANDSNSMVYIAYKYNWRTGWLESVQIQQKYFNGTMMFNYNDQRGIGGSNVLNTDIKDLGIIVIPIIVAIGIILGIKYKKH